jgi:hypothetical protein
MSARPGSLISEDANTAIVPAIALKQVAGWRNSR